MPGFDGSLSIKAVIRGTAVWRAGQRCFAVNENSWLVLNDHQHYSLEIDSREPTTTFCLFFERGLVEDIWRVTMTRPEQLLEKPDVDDPVPCRFFEALGPKQSVVAQMIRRFAAVSRQTDNGAWNDWFVAIGRLLVREQRDVSQRAARLPAARSSTRTELCRRVLRGRDMLLASTNGSLPLKLVAREACLSPYHFHRTFRQMFGQTPHAFLREQRLGRAAEALRETERTVSDIAIANGFESLPSFSALFRRRFGLPPREFRASHGRSGAIRKIG